MQSRVMRVAVRPIADWLIDWACILGWVAITLAIGLPLSSAGIIRPCGANQGRASSVVRPSSHSRSARFGHRAVSLNAEPIIP
jgi:hypothetical protein